MSADERAAFEAGWMAAQASARHEWGPQPPMNPGTAFTLWKNTCENGHHTFNMAAGVKCVDCDRLRLRGRWPCRKTYPIMNIRTLRGEKVMFAFPDGGYLSDQAKCAKHLTVNTVYTVDHTDVGSSHTDVWLQEVPGVSFNSVMFTNVIFGEPT